MVDDTGTTMPRRLLGRALREQRTDARITLEAAAKPLGCSAQKLRRIENGQTTASARDVQAMCQLYEISPELTDVLLALAGEANVTGWWHAHGESIPDWYDLYAGLEATAHRLREHSNLLIPPLLQTRAYTTEVYRSRPDLSQPERARLVKAQLARQALLHRRIPAPPRLDTVLSEAALMRLVDNPATMAAQLRHLLEQSHLPEVSIRVVPFTTGLYHGMITGPFVLLDFPPGNLGPSEPPIVYRESLTGALYLDRKHELDAYERCWTNLDETALDEEQSRHLIEKIMIEVHHG